MRKGKNMTDLFLIYKDYSEEIKRNDINKLHISFLIHSIKSF